MEKPEKISFESAAVLTADDCTALQFCKKTKMTRGDNVLVVGTSGGLESVTVQIARSVVGEEGMVVGICSAANADLVK